MKLKCVLVLGGLLLTVCLFLHDVSAGDTPTHSAEQDREALLALENVWLNGEHDAAVLDRILAADFVHPFPTGDFLTKTQHVFYATKYPPPAKFKVAGFSAVAGTIRATTITNTATGKSVVIFSARDRTPCRQPTATRP